MTLPRAAGLAAAGVSRVSATTAGAGGVVVGVDVSSVALAGAKERRGCNCKLLAFRIN